MYLQNILPFIIVCFFQAMHEETMEHLLLLPLDNDDNTIAHLAALEGISSVFKVTYNANVYVHVCMCIYTLFSLGHLS